MSSLAINNHLCSVTLLGNLVSKPEIRYQANPVVAVAEFSLATHKRWFDKTTNQYKEWTSFHTVKIIGDVVERSLIHCQKGDIILIQGYLINSKRNGREIIHATYAQTYEKGFARSINQIHCSGTVAAPITLVTTEQNVLLAEVSLTIEHNVLSALTHEYHQHTIVRPVHIWGKQAQYIKDNASEGDQLIIDGKLSYLNNATKSQMIDASQVVLIKQS